MYKIIVGCEARPTVFSECIRSGMGWQAENLTDPMPDRVRTSLAEAGWVERDGKFYCPRHDPAKGGLMVDVSMDYVEVAPGVRARWPGAHQQGDSMRIEVQVDEIVEHPTRALAKFDSPEAKQWKADVVETMARRAAGLEG